MDTLTKTMGPETKILLRNGRARKLRVGFVLVFKRWIPLQAIALALLASLVFPASSSAATLFEKFFTTMDEAHAACDADFAPLWPHYGNVGAWCYPGGSGMTLPPDSVVYQSYFWDAACPGSNWFDLNSWVNCNIADNGIYYYAQCAQGEVFSGPAPGKCRPIKCVGYCGSAGGGEGSGSGAGGGGGSGSGAGGGGGSGSGAGGAGGDGPDAGNPCNAGNGNKYQVEVDYQGGDSRLSLSRTYSSLLANMDIGIGYGWTSSFSARLDNRTNELIVRRADGSGEMFVKDATGVWQGEPDTKIVLTEDASGFTVTRQVGYSEHYDSTGHLIASTDPSGKTTQYQYDAGGKLTSVTGPFGHTLSLAYSTDGRLQTVTNPVGQSITYTYDAQGNLSRVTFPDNSGRVYHYENTAFPHHLTGITGENGVRLSTYAYDGAGNVFFNDQATTENGAPQERFTLNYDGSTQTTVTNPLGVQRVLTFEDKLGMKNLLKSQNLGDGKTVTQTFDANNNLIARTDPEGRTMTYTYNATNQKLSQTQASGTPQARTTTYTYLSDTLSLPTTVTTASIYAGNQRQTITAYDTGNRPLTITQNGFTPTGTAISRTVSMQYNAAG